MSTTSSSAGCFSPLPAMKRYDSLSPLLLYSPFRVAGSRSPPPAAMKRKTRVDAMADVRRILNFDSDSDSEESCCTPMPSRENVTVAVRGRLDFDSAAVPPPPRKSRMEVAESARRKLDFDSAEDAGTPQRPRSCIALRRCPPPSFPAVRWNPRAMKSYLNNLAAINMR